MIPDRVAVALEDPRAAVIDLDGFLRAAAERPGLWWWLTDEQRLSLFDEALELLGLDER